MARIDKWKNYGGVSPREGNGLFIKYNPDNEKFSILQTTALEKADGFDYIYIIEYDVVNKETLVSDERLAAFAGFKKAGNKTIGTAIILAMSWIQCYGSPDGPYEVTNYWGELKKYGIYPYKFNK